MTDAELLTLTANILAITIFKSLFNNFVLLQMVKFT